MAAEVGYDTFGCMLESGGPHSRDRELNKRQLADIVLMKNRLCVYSYEYVCVCVKQSD